MAAYFARADLEARLTARTVAQIYDDDKSGDPDAAPLAMLIADACSKVDSYLAGAYELPLTAPTNEVKRLALDVAVALAAQRHGEYVRRDWAKLMAAAEGELEKLRDGKTLLASAPGVDVPANQGGSFSPDAPCAVLSDDGRGHIFIGGMGDY